MGMELGAWTHDDGMVCCDQDEPPLGNFVDALCTAKKILSEFDARAERYSNQRLTLAEVLRRVPGKLPHSREREGVIYKTTAPNGKGYIGDLSI